MKKYFVILLAFAFTAQAAEKSLRHDDVTGVVSSPVTVNFTNTVQINGEALEGLKSNRIAVAAPAVTDDSASGYAVGSEWQDVVASKLYQCFDASVGAAVWVEITAGGTPTSHASSHEDGGSDEVQVENLPTLLADGQLLITKLGGVVPLTPPPGNNASFRWFYDDVDHAATDPGIETFKTNNASPASIMALYIDDLMISSMNGEAMLSGLASGDLLLIQQAAEIGTTTLRSVLFSLTGAPTDNTGFWTIPVTVESNTGSAWETGKQIDFIVVPQGVGGGDMLAATYDIGVSGIVDSSEDLESVAITGKTIVTGVTGDFVLISDTSDSGNLKKVNLSDLLGGGAGDLLAANNLSDVAVAATSLSNLGGIGAATSDTLTNKSFNANGTGNVLTNVDVADLANGTDGELITWSAAGVAATVDVGTVGQVLTSAGPGAPPTFESAGSGTDSFFIPAAAFVPTSTGPPSAGTRTATNSTASDFFAFDDTTDEFAIVTFAMPGDFDDSQPITIDVYWSSGASSGTVVWRFQAGQADDGENFPGALGNFVAVSDTPAATSDRLNIATTGNVSFSPFTSSNELLVLRTQRDADNGSDDLVGDTKFYGIRINYETQ